MIETVTEFEEFRRKASTHYRAHYRFRTHPTHDNLEHLHFDMTAPSASVHFYNGKPTHIVRFKYREVGLAGHPAIGEREGIFRGYCQKTFIEPLGATEGDWI